MDIQFYDELFSLFPDSRTDKILSDRSKVIWIDWREEEDSIAESIARRIPDLKLKAEITASEDAEFAYEAVISSESRSITVSPLNKISTQHQTLLALNELLENRYEIRYAVCSNGCDSAAVIAEPCEVWESLTQKYETISEWFVPVTEFTDLFRTPADQIAAAAKSFAAKNRSAFPSDAETAGTKRPWWKFW